MSTEGTFKKIDDNDEQAPGPPTVLVCGFSPEIEAPLKEVLAEVEAQDHRVIFCTPSMVKRPLGDALATEPAEESPAAPDALPRAMVLSGLTGAQIQEFLGSYHSSGLPRPIFASVTPANLEFPVGKLLVELIAEQRAMNRRRR